MAKRENFYRRDPNKALSGMIGLSLEERGVYNTVLDMLYQTWRPLEDDRRYIANWCGCAVQKLNPIIARLLERGRLITFEEGGRTYISDEAFEAERKAVKGGAGTRSGRAQVAEKSGEVEEKSASVGQNSELLGTKTTEKQSIRALEKTREDKNDANASSVRSVPDDAFMLAWKAYPALGRSRSKSQAKTKPVWRAAATAAGGEDRLLAAVRRYLAEDTTYKGDCGPPAFDRWLRDGRWEHWLPGATVGSDAATPAPAAVFDGPEQVRAWVADHLGEPYARSYIDPARWDGSNRALIAANPFAEGKLKRDLAPICDRWKFTVRLAAANDPKPDLFARGDAA
jgi:uncharacterized protein YdaU (DUF1376 family)